MSKFVYLPEMEVETSSYVAVPISAVFLSNKNYNERKFLYDVGSHKNAKYLSWYSLENQKTTISTAINTSFNYGEPPTKTKFYVIPDEKVCEKLIEFTGVSTVRPVIVPPEYKTPEEAAKYIVDNGFSYDYQNGVINTGFFSGLYLNIENGKKLSPMLDIESGYYRLYSNLFKDDAKYIEQSLLHVILINEFIIKASSSKNMNLKFEEFISDKENVKKVKEKFSKLEFSIGDYSYLIIDTLIKNYYTVNKTPLSFIPYNTIEKREAFYNLTAQVAVDFLIAFDGVGRHFDYILPKEKQTYYESLQEVKVYKNTYDLKNVVNELFLSLNKNNTTKEDKKKDNNVFNVNNVNTMFKIVFGKQVDNCLEKIFEEKNVDDFNYITDNIGALYQKIENGSKRNDSITTILNSFGYNYLSNHMKPTNMLALWLLCDETSKTMKNNYLKNLTKFLDKNLKSLKNDDVKRKGFIADLIYEINYNLLNVVVYDFSSEVSIVDNDEELEKLSLPLVLNMFLNSYDLDEHCDKFNDREIVEKLRFLGI